MKFYFNSPNAGRHFPKIFPLSQKKLLHFRQWKIIVVIASRKCIKNVKIVEDLGESLIDGLAVEPAAVNERICVRCNYRWLSRLPAAKRPKACPECKSRMWDKSGGRRRFRNVTRETYHYQRPEVG